METIKFQKEAVERAEEELRRIDIDPNYRQMTIGFVKLLQEHIDLPEIVLKGNVWLTIKQWQMENHKTIADVQNMPPQERFAAGKEMFMLGKERTKRLLANRGEQEELVDKAYEIVFQKYIEFAQKGFQQQ